MCHIINWNPIGFACLISAKLHRINQCFSCGFIWYMGKMSAFEIITYKTGWADRTAKPMCQLYNIMNCVLFWFASTAKPPKKKIKFTILLYLIISYAHKSFLCFLLSIPYLFIKQPKNLEWKHNRGGTSFDRRMVASFIILRFLLDSRNKVVKYGGNFCNFLGSAGF